MLGSHFIDINYYKLRKFIKIVLKYKTIKKLKGC